jgi:hypothetical protein
VTSAGSAEIRDARYFDSAFENRVKNESEFDRQRPLLEASSGRTITSCRDLLALSAQEIIAEAWSEQRIFADYQICFALEALANAGPPSPTMTDDSAPAALLRRRLDLGSFANSLRISVPKRPLYFADLGQPLHLVGDRTLLIDSADWLFQIDVLAAADFDRSGHIQWLAHLLDRGKRTSYFDDAYLIIDVDDRKEAVRARRLGH